ncbi:MAG: ABC transporter permease [Candidatus Dormibacteraeota bacterium]|nr:ABC transporter permease [Candidatus Dormibacteraeota bacterium]
MALRELLSRPAASFIAALGLLTATLGFIALASTSQTAVAALTGDIKSGWQTPYDLLVRPANSASQLETKSGLVRPNFLMGLVGGISMRQVEAIRNTPGVGVAAPIAMLGFLQWPTEVTVNLGPASSAPLTVFRVSTVATGEGGLSTYPLSTQYIVVAPRGIISPGPNVTPVLRIGSKTVQCNGLDVICSASTDCTTNSVPNPSPTDCRNVPANQLTVARVPFNEPLMVAGIDPSAENTLTGLDRCIVGGRYLTNSDTVLAEGPATAHGSTIPILVSDKTFVDESLSITISRASDPSPLLAGSNVSDLSNWNETGQQVSSTQDLYKGFLQTAIGFFNTSALISPGDVQYQIVGPGHLAALTQIADPSVYLNNAFSQTPLSAGQSVPAEANDTWFRSLTPHQPNNQLAPNKWAAVGSYDPSCLPTFRNLIGGGRMEAYAAPIARLPNGKALGPTRNQAGYLSSPPLLLTTLSGAAFLADPSRYHGAPGPRFISAVRIRVIGTDVPGRIAEARLSRTAADIHQETGLLVDIVKGSSPQTINVDLPGGKFGRPPVTVSELWSVKGVAFRFVRAVQAQNLALFVVVLVGAMVLVGQTTYTAVRRRQRELGTLRAIGWPRLWLAWLVELEMLLLGVGVGAVALCFGLVLRQLLHLGTATWQWLAAIPLAMAISGLSAVVPAISASNGTVVAAMATGGRVRKSRFPGSVVLLGIRDLMSAWRTEFLLGACAVGLGSGLVGVVILVAAAFRGQLDATVLGSYLSAEIQPFHFVLAGVAMALGVMSAAEIITLSYLERQPSFAALRAIGWPRMTVAKMLAGQAIVIGLSGGVVGVLVVVATGFVLGGSAVSILVAAAGCLAASQLATGLALLTPFFLVYRLAPAEALKVE